MPLLSIEELESAAKRQDWEVVDAALPGVCNQPTYVTWATQAVSTDINPDVRDLAAGLLELTSHDFDKDLIKELRACMVTDDNRYVRFRLAFALFRHGDRTTDTIDLIQRACGDPDVAETALAYMAKLGPEH